MDSQTIQPPDNVNNNSTISGNSGKQTTEEGVRTSNSWPGVIKALGIANTAIKNNSSPYLFYVGALAIVEILILILVKRPASSRFTSDQIAALGESVVVLLFLPFINNYMLGLAKGRKQNIKQLFSLGARKYFNLYITFIMFIPIILIGALLVFIPLIWILPWYYLVFYPVIDLDYGPRRSFQYVRTLSKNNLGKLWAILGLYWIIAFALSLIIRSEALTTFLGSIISLMFETVVAMLYIWLKEHNSHIISNPQNNSTDVKPY